MLLLKSSVALLVPQDEAECSQPSCPTAHQTELGALSSLGQIVSLCTYDNDIKFFIFVTCLPF